MPGSHTPEYWQAYQHTHARKLRKYHQNYYREHQKAMITTAKNYYRDRLTQSDKAGTEQLAAGLLRIWYKGCDLGKLEYIPNEPHRERWHCEAGKFQFKRDALNASVVLWRMEAVR